MTKTTKLYLKLIRPHQWIKNVILFAGLIFGKKFTHFESVIHSFEAFLLFSLIASCQYVINDYLDREEDAKHPEKRHRPFASGAIDPTRTLIFTTILFCASMIFSYILHPYFFWLVGFYFIFNILYSVYLKHTVILDVMAISVGFVIRAIAGAIVVNVEFSNWLLLCTFMLSLYWGFGKRRGELILLEDKATHHRKILQEYSVTYLDLMLGITSALTLVSYIMYTVSPSTIANLGTDKLVYTIPIVVYAIFRSLYIIYIKNMGHNPTKAIITDVSVLVSGGVWLVVVTMLLYFTGTKSP